MVEGFSKIFQLFFCFMGKSTHTIDNYFEYEKKKSLNPYLSRNGPSTVKNKLFAEKPRITCLSCN
jgi:hypothetical protein